MADVRVKEGALHHVHDELKRRVGDDRFAMWFGEAEFAIDDETFVVGVPNVFYSEYLNGQFRSVLEEVVVTSLGHPMKIGFRIDSELFKAHRQRQQQQSRQPSQPDSENPNAGAKSRRDAPPPTRRDREPSRSKEKRHRHSFDTFVVGECNRLAHTASQRFVDGDLDLNPLTIYSGVGLGKTHLLMSIANAVASGHRGRVKYTTAERFTNEFLKLLHNKKVHEFREKYRKYDVLAIDDLQFLAGKRATQDELLHTLNELVDDGMQVVLSCDQHPKSLANLHPGLAARLQGGMVCKLDKPDYDTRLEILSARSRRLEREFCEPVIDHIASNLTSDIRAMEGALNCLAAHDAMGGRVARDLEAAKEALTDIIHHTVKVVKLDDVEQAVCETFGLDPKVLKSGRRVRSVSYPRMLAMYLARNYTGATLDEIGTYFGRRKHSTVMAALNRVSGWIDEKAVITIGDERWPIAKLLGRLEKQLD